MTQTRIDRLQAFCGRERKRLAGFAFLGVAMVPMALAAMGTSFAGSATRASALWSAEYAALARVPAQECQEPCGVATDPGPSTASVSFSANVLPLFLERCAQCHFGPLAPRRLVLDNYDSIMAGSTRGPVIVPGDPDSSFLMNAVRTGFMPMGGPELSSEELRILTDWIAAGANND